MNPALPTLLDWHQSHWDRFVRQLHQQRLSHAYLLAGPPDTGKSTLAEQMAARLLCQGATGPETACGECARCRLIAAGTHPDLLRVTLEGSRQILVDQIRDLIEWAQQTSQQGGLKVCMIDPADALNVQSSNALLKCLEEPPRDTVIMMVTDRPSKLLPTLRSRCQRIDTHFPERDAAIRWLEGNRLESGDRRLEASLMLEIAGGSPLRAVNQLTDEFLDLRARIAARLIPLSGKRESPLAAAEAFSKSDPGEVLDILFQLVADSIAWSMSGGQVLRNHDLERELIAFSESVSLEHRHAFIDRMNRVRGILGGTSNANLQMLMEWLLSDAA